MKEQAPSQNIQQEIDMMSFIFYGKMRNGKTINAIYLALDSRYNGRIYSNVDIYKNGKSILTRKIKSYDQLDNIQFSYTHGIILIDEAGLNANSKDTRSAENRILQKVLFLAGKKNCSVIWIAQRYESIDINARVLADIIIECRKIKRYGKHPKFKLIKQRQKLTKLETIQAYTVDTIKGLKMLGITYDTLEESVMLKIKN